MSLLTFWRGSSPRRRFEQGERAFDRRDYARAAACWKEAATVGHGEAAARLAEMYDRGTGVLSSLADAKHWYGIAAEHGLPSAQRRLAELCLLGSAVGGRATFLDDRVSDALCPNGIGVTPDEPRARRWALAAAEQGDVDAQALLGYLLASGRGGDPDPEEAARWYRLAATHGNARAELGLGILTAGPHLGKPDPVQAMAWFRRAADRGNRVAVYYIGVLHERGLGAPVDRETAVECFRQAASRGVAEAQRQLGRAYLVGEGVAQDVLEAERWLRRACAQGDVEAMAFLGDLHARAGKRSPEAVAWYRRAAEGGHARAAAILARRGGPEGVSFNEPKLGAGGGQ